MPHPGLLDRRQEIMTCLVGNRSAGGDRARSARQDTDGRWSGEKDGVIGYGARRLFTGPPGECAPRRSPRGRSSRRRASGWRSPRGSSRRNGPGHPGAPDASHPHAVFHRQYAGGAAPWDTGEPQPEMVALEDAGTFGPRVLDVGCGTGALSLFLASRGHEVLGVDAVDAAIEQARAKASERGLDCALRGRRRSRDASGSR